MNKDLISIIMPTYNVEKYVGQAIESILNQTYKEFELIIIDDGSTDNTFSILKNYSKKDKRIRIFKNSQNLRIVKTLNKGLKLATGNYIARMDGDDISLPTRLEIEKKYLDDNQNVDIVSSQMYGIDESGKIINKKKYPVTKKYIEKSMKFLPSLAHIWLARKEAYIKLREYRNIPYAEDYDLLLRGMKLGLTYVNLPDYLYEVRIRSGNTNSSNGLRQQKARLLAQQLYKSEGNQFIFIDDKYFEEKTSSSKRENAAFVSASNNLQLAIKNKQNKAYMAFKTIEAMFQSKYIFNYVLMALHTRLVLLEENFVKTKGK